MEKEIKYYEGTTVPVKAVMLGGMKFGMAMDGPFASTAWRLGLFHTGGTKFEFKDVFGNQGLCHRDDIKAMTQAEWDFLHEKHRQIIIDS